MTDYIVIKPYLGLEVGTLLLESEGYLVNSEMGESKLNPSFLENSEYFKKVNKIEEYIPNDEVARYKMELIIKCTEKERDMIYTFIQDNISRIKSGEAWI